MAVGTMTIRELIQSVAEGGDTNPRIPARLCVGTSQGSIFDRFFVQKTSSWDAIVMEDKREVRTQQDARAV